LANSSWDIYALQVIPRIISIFADLFDNNLTFNFGNLVASGPKNWITFGTFNCLCFVLTFLNGNERAFLLSNILAGSQFDAFAFRHFNLTANIFNHLKAIVGGNLLAICDGTCRASFDRDF
jgi:hypothetical protein